MKSLREKLCWCLFEMFAFLHQVFLEESISLVIENGFIHNLLFLPPFFSSSLFFPPFYFILAMIGAQWPGIALPHLPQDSPELFSGAYTIYAREWANPSGIMSIGCPKENWNSLLVQGQSALSTAPGHISNFQPVFILSP